MAGFSICTEMVTKHSTECHTAWTSRSVQLSLQGIPLTGAAKYSGNHAGRLLPDHTPNNAKHSSQGSRPSSQETGKQCLRRVSIKLLTWPSVDELREHGSIS